MSDIQEQKCGIFFNLFKEEMKNLYINRETPDDFKEYHILKILCFYRERNDDVHVSYFVKCIKYFLARSQVFKSKFYEKEINDFYQLYQLFQNLDAKEFENEGEGKLLYHEIRNLFNNLINTIRNNRKSEYWKCDSYEFNKFENDDKYRFLDDCLKAKPWPDRKQTEEFFTQALTLTLNESKYFLRKFIKMLKESYEKVNDCKNEDYRFKESNVFVKSEDCVDNNNRIDVTIRQSERKEVLFAIENKVDSWYDDVQLLRYSIQKDSPIVYSITQRVDCISEYMKKLFSNKDGICEDRVNDCSIDWIIEEFDGIHDRSKNQWGGHLFWVPPPDDCVVNDNDPEFREDDVLTILQDAIENTREGENSFYYLNYLEKLLLSLKEDYIIGLQTLTQLMAGFDQNKKDVMKKIEYDPLLDWEISNLSIGNTGPIMSIYSKYKDVKKCAWPFRIQKNGKIRIQQPTHLNAFVHELHYGARPDSTIRDMIREHDGFSQEIRDQLSQGYTLHLEVLQEEGNYEAFKDIVKKLKEDLDIIVKGYLR